MLVGIDEVGRGAWAGPLLVVAARAGGKLSPDVRDSKRLTKSQREALFVSLQETCEFGEGWVQPNEIDEHGLATAMRLGVERALTSLGATTEDEVILDGIVNYCPVSYTKARCEVAADNRIPIVSAASIYAKVRRDRHMQEVADYYPGYGFDKHVGYGTALHRQALQNLGLTKLHRTTYKPVAQYA